MVQVVSYSWYDTARARMLWDDSDIVIELGIDIWLRDEAGIFR